VSQKSENVLRDFLFENLFRLMGAPESLHPGQRFSLQGKFGGGECQIAGSLRYCLPSDRSLTYACDLLFSFSDGRHVSVLTVFRPSGAELFKAAAYDTINLKKEHGERVLTILAYAQSSGTEVGLDLARDHSYPFDQFLGRQVRGLDDLGALESLAAEIRDCVARFASIPAAAAAAK
jgi:hypothetical protein